MSSGEKGSTQRMNVPVDPDQSGATCPYCKKPLETPEDRICPHCNLPIKRRRRRQVTTQTGPVARLVLHRSDAANKEYSLLKQIITIGRNTDNTIQIDSPFISNHHAKIEYTPEGHTIVDLSSTNGTRVNGQSLKADKPQALTDQDIIRFNDGRGNSIQLTYLAATSYNRVDESKAGRTYQLDAGENFVGRGFDAHIVLSHPAVSWYHAKITVEADQYLLEDMSTHGDTMLNGNQLLEPSELRQGDVIGVGPFNLIYQGEGVLSSFVAGRNFNVEVADLEKTVYGVSWLGLPDPAQSKQILRDIDLDINPREFVALVGGSGSGKSTLLKALIGLSPATGGQVLINGHNLYEHLMVYRHLIGYVPQDDIIHLDLSVRQALEYSLHLRVPEQDPTERERVIDDVLDKMGLTTHATTIVGDLSGGQRKRVSIAAELLGDPWIFFLDEPTSGLDPGLEKLMMDTLRQLADEGRTIILITHAINHIVDHCDQVIFLSQGELAYFGPPNQAMDYFDVDNFPDIYTVLSNPPASVGEEPVDEAASWGEQYRQSELYQTFIKHRKGGETVSYLPQPDKSLAHRRQRFRQQFRILSRRYLDLIKADRFSLWLLFAVMPIVAIFLLLIGDARAFVGHTAAEIMSILEETGRYTIAAETQTLLFIMALATALIGIFSAGYEYIKEAAIYRRERMITLRITSYFSSKMAVLGGFIAIQLLAFLIILAFKFSFPQQGLLIWPPLEIFFTLLLTGLASLALGLFISTIATSKDMVTYLILLVILIQILFSGAIFELTIMTELLSFVTVTRWALEALALSVDLEALNALGQVRVENTLETGRGLQTLLQDVAATTEFYNNYNASPLGLVARWLLLIGHILIWSQLAMWQLRRKDQV